MGLEDPYGSLPTQHILPYESSKYQGAGWTLQGQSRQFFIRVQTQLARDEPQGELFSPSVICNVLGAWWTRWQLLMPVLYILCLWGTQHLGREGKYLIPSLEYENHELCVISDVHRISQPGFRNSQAAIHTN